MEVIETGHLRRLDYERTEETVVAQLFLGIHGVGKRSCNLDHHSMYSPCTALGPGVAKKWYDIGLRTIYDLRQRKFGVKLTPAQEVRKMYFNTYASDPSPRLGSSIMMVGFNIPKEFPISLIIQDLKTKMPRQEVKDIFDQVRAVGESFSMIIGQVLTPISFGH